MDTVINIIQLVLFVLTAFLYLTGLGWLVIGPILHGNLTHSNADTSLLQEIPLVILAGLILNYGLGLLVQSLRTSLLIGAILSFCGSIAFFKYIHSRRLHWPPHNTTISKLIGITVTSLVILVPILVEPLSEWDARSFWFFHAKMIYNAGSTGLAAGWLNPAVSWSHLDYPKLVPVLAGQITFVFGLWNEYLPKLALFFILVPGITWLFTFAKKSLGFLALIALIPFNFYPWIWNGYMDGLLAFFFSISLLLLGRYLSSSKPIDLVSCIACAVMLLYLKNEGALAAIALVLAIVVAILLSRKQVNLKAFLDSHWRYILGMGILLVPFFVWAYYKQRWNITNDLQLGTSDSVSRIISRLGDGSLRQVLKSEYQQIMYQLMILALFLLASFSWKIKPAREGLPALVAAGIYLLGMTIIYLLTPQDLTWHLWTTIDRTMLTVNGGIIVGWYFLLTKMGDYPL